MLYSAGATLKGFAQHHSRVVQGVKNMPAMQQTQEQRVQSLGQDDPPEKVMATHSIILPGESHGQRSLVGCIP